MPIALRLSGPLNRDALAAALADVVRRHEVLRTGFAEMQGRVRQVMHEANAAMTVPVMAVSAQADMDATVTFLAAQPFHLDETPPMRVHLIEAGAEEHVLLIVAHHIMCDGWSYGPLLRDLAEAYEARIDGHGPARAGLPVQYSEYAVWQREMLGDPAEPGSTAAVQSEYWQATLAGLPDELDIPADRRRSSSGSGRGDQVRFDLSPVLSERLAGLARDRGCTLFMALHAAVAALLSRLGAGDDVPLGTVTAGRVDEALEEMVGLFVNTLVLRVDVSGDPSFMELLGRVRAVMLGAFTHQDLPFERVVELVNPGRVQGRNPLFQTSVELHLAEDSHLEFGGLGGQLLPLRLPVAKFDLSWDFVEKTRPAGLECELTYAVDLFDRATVSTMADRFLLMLESAVNDPGTPVSRLPVADEREVRRSLDAGWRPDHAGLEYGFIHRVRDHALRQPQAPAICGAGGSVAYQTLVGRSSALARRLASAGASTGDVIPVIADRGAGAATAFLGIATAGAVYLPLDVAAPRARLVSLVKDAGARCLAADARYAGEAAMISSAAGGVEVLILDDAADPPDGLAPVLGGPDDLAYMLYTSGSTGMPKGALVHRRGMLNNLLGEAEALGITGPSLVAATAPLTFDISIWQMFTALIFGGAVLAVPDEDARDPRALLRIVAEAGVQVLQMVPSLLQTTLDDMDGAKAGEFPAGLPLRVLAVTGEALPAALCGRWFQRFPDIPIVNCYGPTECSDDVAHATITAGHDAVMARVPIGRAARGSRLYVLDDWLQPLPDTVPGELYVGGLSVGYGYHRDPGRTAASFVADPFTEESGARMYRTGDIVSRRRDGQLEFLGRRDHQVKIRGQRIELGEVEHALCGLAGVRAGIVTTVSGPGGHQVLVGYYTGRGEQDALRAALAERLPAAMVPSVLIPVGHIPLTRNGKVDRAALPRPDFDARPSGRAPEGARETLLSHIFEEVLGVSVVGADDDFFGMGGHSLLAVHLMRQVNDAFSTQLPLASIFTCPTPAALASALAVPADSLTEEGPEPCPATDMAADSELDPGIAAAGAVSVSSGPPEQVFLTGATGFLGVFLLDELLRTTQATVRCLVRAADEDAALDRLLHAVARYRLPAPEPGRITVIAGDLEQSQFGLTAKRFQDLADHIDLIVHNGARVSMVDTYTRLRAANVGGTREILRLAASGKVKRVHYVSTVSTVGARPGDPAELPEDWVTDPGAVSPGGYEQTKWVAERMVSRAAERGIPVTIYRPGRISGHRTTGVTRADDAFWHYVRACVELGVAPDATWRGFEDNLVPVDWVAAAIVRLALVTEPVGTVYHLINSRPVLLQDVLRYARDRGYPMALMPFPQWKAAVERAARSLPAAADSSVHAVALFNDGIKSETGDVLARPRLSRRNTESALAGSDLHCPPVDDELLSSYFRYLVESQFLPPPGTGPRPAAAQAGQPGGRLFGDTRC
jgi:amino acid adenylation domain-containing protein/thioester reductase-like protein